MPDSHGWNKSRANFTPPKQDPERQVKAASKPQHGEEPACAEGRAGRGRRQAAPAGKARCQEGPLASGRAAFRLKETETLKRPEGDGKEARLHHPENKARKQDS